MENLGLLRGKSIRILKRTTNVHSKKGLFSKKIKKKKRLNGLKDSAGRLGKTGRRGKGERSLSNRIKSKERLN